MTRVGQIVRAPLVQVLMIAGGIIGTALVANWRETADLAAAQAVSAARIADLTRRVETLERKEP